MKTQQQKIISKFDDLSLKYHKISLLFNELAGSLRIKAKEFGQGNVKQFKEYIKNELNLDPKKLLHLTKAFESIKLGDIQNE